MNVVIRGREDKALRAVRDALAAFPSDDPAGEAVVYRRSSGLIFVRMVDASFRGLGWAERDDLASPALEGLPDEVATQVMFFLLLPPEEVATSGANGYFEDHSPKRRTRV